MSVTRGLPQPTSLLVWSIEIFQRHRFSFLDRLGIWFADRTAWRSVNRLLIKFFVTSGKLNTCLALVHLSQIIQTDHRLIPSQFSDNAIYQRPGPPINWPGVGVTKANSSVPLISRFFTIVKALVTYWISCSYLTGVAAAQLRWHLSNMNVIQII